MCGGRVSDVIALRRKREEGQGDGAGELEMNVHLTKGNNIGNASFVRLRNPSMSIILKTSRS
jgi:hypothetical protein